MNPDELIINIPSEISCFICLDNMDEPNYYCENCKMNVHEECMKKYVSTKLDSTSNNVIICSECRTGIIDIIELKPKKKYCCVDILIFCVLYTKYIILFIFLFIIVSFFLLIAIIFFIFYN